MGWSRGACAARRGTRQEVMSGAATSVKRGLRQAAGVVLDFALPPRCAGCAEVLDEIDGFCAACWSAVHWIGGDARRAGCRSKEPRPNSAGGGPCQAAAARKDARGGGLWRDAVTIALRLEYDRRIALSRTMARFMAPLSGAPSGDELLVPVPLHRWRLWSRGFDQSALIAGELGRRWQSPVNYLAGFRVRRHPKGMSHCQRRSAVAGAFMVSTAGRSC